MISFAKEKLGWLNHAVRNTNISVKKNICAKFTDTNYKKKYIKNTYKCVLIYVSYIHICDHTRPLHILYPLLF